LARSIADGLGVPFAIGDATTLTEAGYVGEDVENLLLKLFHAADGSIADAEKGVLYIDEIDKVGKRTQNTSITRDVSGEGVQQGLLKLMEGTVANIPPQGGRKHPEQQYLQINTTNILFICGGTFEGGGGSGRIEEIVGRRLSKRSIGFHHQPTGDDNQRQDDELREQIMPEDLINYGMIPEFVGRLPILASLHALNVDHLTRILTEPVNSSIQQLQTLFSLSNVQLDFNDEALKEIATKAYELKTGARGLGAVVSKLMHDVEFNIDEYDKKKILITGPMVLGEEPITATDQKEAA